MFQELDTPPVRCCWRCGCAISCVSQITADIDQAFEAFSASAVLPAWRHISQSYESTFSSNSVLVRRGRREFCKPKGSQSFGRGWFSFSTPVLARALFSFTSVSLVMLGSMVWQIRGIPIGGVMSGRGAGCGGTCMVGSTTEAQGVQPRVLLKLHFVFLRVCCLVPISLVSGADAAVHTWVDVELRVVGQHVAVNIKNPNRSWVHGRGPQQKSTFLPWTGS